MHDVENAAEYVPAAQATHALAPDAAAKEPAAQLVHEVAPAGEYDPAEHALLHAAVVKPAVAP